MGDIERFEIRNLDPELIRAERERVLEELRRLLPFATILEVGSTAVDGIVGKQDVDFLVRVREAEFNDVRSALDRALPRNEDQLSDRDFQGYRVSSPLDVAVQLTVRDGRYDVFEGFLELLRSDTELRRAYNELKMAFDFQPMDAYRAAKSKFIEKALAHGNRRAGDSSEAE